MPYVYCKKNKYINKQNESRAECFISIIENILRNHARQFLFGPFDRRGN